MRVARREVLGLWGGLAAVLSLGFNYVFIALWMTEYGEREGMKRFLRDYDGNDRAAPPPPPKPPKA